jgi:predicted ester cyclase
VHFEIEDIVQQDDRLATRVTLKGTQRGEFAGIPVTGKRMKVYDFATYRIVSGKITDVWSLIDMQGLRDQLEAQGSPGSSGKFR